jgi:hypothetical protein
MSKLLQRFGKANRTQLALHVERLGLFPDAAASTAAASTTVPAPNA